MLYIYIVKQLQQQTKAEKKIKIIAKKFADNKKSCIFT